MNDTTVPNPTNQSTGKPTAAAQRTAEVIAGLMVYALAEPGNPDVHRPLAEIIDRETGLPELLAACKAWVTYFDRIMRDAEPGDAVAVMTQRYHGERVAQTRAAIQKAEGQPERPR